MASVDCSTGWVEESARRARPARRLASTGPTPLDTVALLVCAPRSSWQLRDGGEEEASFSPLVVGGAPSAIDLFNYSHQVLKLILDLLCSWELADEDCTAAIAVDPTLSKAYWRRGLARKERGVDFAQLAISGSYSLLNA